MQELSALKLKRNVLEIELPGHELDESPKYQTLVESIENQKEAIRELEDDLDLDQVDLYL